jgi:hypothetical protein
MSLFKKLKKGIKKVAKGGFKVATKVASIGQAVQAIQNPAAYAMQMSYSGASARQQFAAPPQYSDYGVPGMSMMRTGGRPARLGSGNALARGASRLPGPAGKVVGGLVLIGGYLYDQYGNVVRKAPSARGRSKGITARELKGFKRVNNLLDQYCKMKPPGGGRRTTKSTSRSKSCR